MTVAVSRVVLRATMFACVALTISQSRALDARASDDSDSRAVDDCRATMEQEARSQGRKAHPASNVELVEVTSKEVESSTLTQIILKSDYDVHMKGALMGWNKFLVSVRVKGKRSKLEKGGWSCSISGSTVLSDTTK